jgi:hypothetical protein
MIRLEANSMEAQIHFIPCLWTRGEGCVNPKRWAYVGVCRLGLADGRLWQAEDDGASILPNLKLMSLGKSGYEQ